MKAMAAPRKSEDRVRLDELLVSRGLYATRSRARDAVERGAVTVDGLVVARPGHAVAAMSDIRIDDPAQCYVSRAALKLIAGLDHFGLDPRGSEALDIGASTGGFTDVLLQRGASHVVALDVGHGQLDWRLRQDPRVTVMERVNARTLTPDSFGGGAQRFGIVTIDVSFISLRLVLAPVPALLEPTGDVVALVKPQFEAGREDVGKGGIVRDAAVHQRVVNEVVDESRRLGFVIAGLTPSPITGAEGNREFLLHLKR
jgi:23S rRNA (cytidine1920-2'-O)/16S rRNA (cytidine1409-2'-O)-methyltransferase